MTAMTAALLCAVAPAQAARPGVIEKIAVVGDNPFRLQIETSTPTVPQVQMVSSPERLVIDLPNSVPAASLRKIMVNRGEVVAVRTGLYSQKPPITRIVVDLNAPQWYRVVPEGSGLLVSLGGQAQGAAEAQSTIGWVSTKAPAGTRGYAPRMQSPPAVLKAVNSPVRRPPNVNGVSVQYANGALSIHCENATLSEVLFQIQKITGAEIAIPSGTEQQRVAGDFGPGTASEVLGDLLNGSGLNFVVVGSETNPDQLRSVILSQKAGDADAPAAFTPQFAPVSAQNTDNDNSEPITPVPQEAPPQQPLPPDSAPPPDPPPTM
jgi:AMIN domain